MATIETIGSSGCDYTSLQAWADAHNADLTSDPNAPYIAQLEPEEFDAGVDLKNEDSLVTDATHYLEITAKPGYEFKGDFYADFPIVGGSIRCVPYTRISHIVFKGSISEVYAVQADGGTIVDSVGVWQVNYTEDSSKSLLAYLIKCEALSSARCESHDTVVVKNCVVYDVSVHNTNTGDSAGLDFRGIVNYSSTDDYYTFDILAYNNVFDKITLSTEGGGSLTFRGIGDRSDVADLCTTTAKNNIIGSQITADTIHCIETSGKGTVVEDYNAVSDSSGAGSHDINNIVSSDVFVSLTSGAEDFHVKESSPEATGGIGPDADSNVPIVGIAGNERSGMTCPMGAYAEAESGGGNVYEVSVMLGSGLGLSSSATAAASASVNLDSSLGVEQGNQAEASAVATLAELLGVSANAVASASGSVTLGKVLSITCHGKLEGAVEVAVTLANSLGISASAIATAHGALDLAYALALGAEARADATAVLALAMQQGISCTFEVGTAVSVELSQKLGLDASATATTLGTLTLDQTLGISVLALAMAQAGISLDSVMELTVSGSTISASLVTPDARTYRVSIEVRSYKVEAENRTYKVEAENRICKIKKET